MNETNLMLDGVMALILERASQTQALWTMYITVVLGILGYLAATASTSSSGAVRSLLLTGFAFFALVNCTNLRDVHFHKDQLIEVVRLKLMKAPDSPEEQHWTAILDRLERGSNLLVPFHIFMDILVGLAIWFVPGKLVRLRARQTTTT